MSLDRLRKRIDALEVRVPSIDATEQLSDFETARWIAFVMTAAADGHRPDWKPMARRYAEILRKS